MDSQLSVLSQEGAGILKCTICSGYLSVAPIKISSKGDKYQCGRCNFNVNGINIRNFIYEELARFIKFPCINLDCRKQILWEDVKEHEIVCTFRKINCPKPACNELLESSQLVSHFESSHKDSITLDKVSVIWGLPDVQDFTLGILLHNEIPYIYLISQTQQRLLGVSVYSLENTTNETYTVSLFTSTGIEMLLHGQKIVPYDDRKHCVECFLKSCTSTSHKYSTNYKNEFEMTTTLNETGIGLDVKSEYCEIFITDGDNGKKRKFFDNTNIIRKTIECPICSNYMLPPIYNCSSGHIICNSCSETLEVCPTCQANTKNSRNYTVEELTENVNLQCAYSDKGCTFIGNSVTLKQHESICRLARGKFVKTS